MNGHSSFIYNSKNNRNNIHDHQHKNNLWYPHNETLLTTTKEGTTDMHNIMYESQSNYSDGQKPDTKDYILYDSIYIPVLKMQTNLQ